MSKAWNISYNVKTDVESLWLNLIAKSKPVPLHALEALGGEEVQLLLIHDFGIRCG
jgi:hypothetical protein